MPYLLSRSPLFPGHTRPGASGLPTCWNRDPFVPHATSEVADMRHYWNRGTDRYGNRNLVLCKACAAALQGQAYKREIPPGAARLTRRGAARLTRRGAARLTRRGAA